MRRKIKTKEDVLDEADQKEEERRQKAEGFVTVTVSHTKKRRELMRTDWIFSTDQNRV